MTVRDMTTGEQAAVPAGELTGHLRSAAGRGQADGAAVPGPPPARH